MSILMLKKRFAGGLGQAILIGMIVVLGIGMVVMFSGLTPKSQQYGQSAEASTNRGEAVALVNGQPISRAQFESTYKMFDGQTRQYFGGGGDLERVGMTRLSALEQLEQSEVIRQDAAAKGIKVSDREINDAIDKAVQGWLGSVKAQMKGRPQDLERTYAQIASRNGWAQQDTLTETKFAAPDGRQRTRHAPRPV